MQTTWRIVRPEFAEEAFTGQGAFLHGGRWHTPGHAVVYTAATRALATLELLANVPRPRRLPEYRMISCHFPEALIDTLNVLLPENWTAYPAPPLLQQLGDAWLLSKSSAILKVPSAVIPAEFNYLLNPEHPDFRSIDIGEPKLFQLNYRLLT